MWVWVWAGVRLMTNITHKGLRLLLLSPLSGFGIPVDPILFCSSFLCVDCRHFTSSLGLEFFSVWWMRGMVMVRVVGRGDGKERRAEGTNPNPKPQPQPYT